MKKILILVLALCLLCGAAAADDTKITINQDSVDQRGSTMVSYTVVPCEEYTVTIDPSVSLSGSGESLSGTIGIKLDTPNFNVPNREITVKLSAAAFKLKNEDQEISYTLKMSGKEYAVGDTVLSWVYGKGTSNTQALVVSATVSSNLPAGNYTDTLTFVVSVSDSNSDETAGAN